LPTLYKFITNATQIFYLLASRSVICQLTLVLQYVTKSKENRW